MLNIKLEELYVHNFLSFYNSEFKFGKINCLIAPNNSGKSNLIEALIFLDNLLYQNPTKAIARVGLKKIKNYHYSEDEVKFTAKFKIQNSVLVGYELINYNYDLVFSFTLDLNNKKSNIDFWINGKIKSVLIDKADIKDSFNIRIINNIHEYIHNYELYENSLKKKIYRSFSFLYNQTTLKYQINSRYDSTIAIIQNLFALNISEKNEQLLKPIDFRLIFNKHSLFSSHYFHTNIMKTTQEVGYDYLLESGNNLAEYLQSLDKDTFEDISTSIIGEVELINALEIKEGFTTELLFKEEVNSKVTHLSMRDVSDGTLHFIAIMSALIGNKESIAIMIEEPERHMHMKTLSYILNTMRDSDKQIFFTTHSTEILQQLELDEILFLFRDFDGNTKGQRARDIPNIKKLMKIYKNDLVEMIQIGILGEYEEE